MHVFFSLACFCCVSDGLRILHVNPRSFGTTSTFMLPCVPVRNYETMSAICKIEDNILAFKHVCVSPMDYCTSVRIYLNLGPKLQVTRPSVALHSFTVSTASRLCSRATPSPSIQCISSFASCLIQLPVCVAVRPSVELRDDEYHL